MKQELADYLNKETDKLKAEQRLERTKKKKITYVIEVATELESWVNPEDVHFAIELKQLVPLALATLAGEVQAGTATAYTTTDFYEN
jgi:hypothetical protein